MGTLSSKTQRGIHEHGRNGQTQVAPLISSKHSCCRVHTHKRGSQQCKASESGGKHLKYRTYRGKPCKTHTGRHTSIPKSNKQEPPFSPKECIHVNKGTHAIAGRNRKTWRCRSRALTQTRTTGEMKDKHTHTRQRMHTFLHTRIS